MATKHHNCQLTVNQQTVKSMYLVTAMLILFLPDGVLLTTVFGDGTFNVSPRTFINSFLPRDLIVFP